jgi:hypothetical protein
MPVVHHHAHRTDRHGNAERQVHRRDPQRPQPHPLLRGPPSGRHPGGARRAGGIRFREPLAQLLLEIGAIEKPPLLEEGAFDPPHQILDTAFLLLSIRPAHFHTEAEIQRNTCKGRIPLGHDAIAPPLQGHGLRAIEDGDEGYPAKRREVIDHRPHQ